jgi:hypothetical protein
MPYPKEHQTTMEFKSCRQGSVCKRIKMQAVHAKPFFLSLEPVSITIPHNNLLDSYDMRMDDNDGTVILQALLSKFKYGVQV